MSIQDTRRLGMEFERRVQIMIPEKEFLEKLDTETIYSFLNQYQDRYMHEIYRNLDKVEPGSKLASHYDGILQGLLKSEEIILDENGVNAQSFMTGVSDSNGVQIVDTARSVKYKLPSDFYLYVRSVSKVGKTFSFKSGSTSTALPIRVLPNELISQTDIWRLIETPHDSLRILRYPAASITAYDNNFKMKNPDPEPEPTENEGQVDYKEYIDDPTSYPTLTVLYDQYTEPKGIKVTYYKEPTKFSLMTNTPCDLPIDAFEELVSGAVDLYIQYVAGAEANRRKQQEALRQQQNENKRKQNNEE